MIGRALVQGIVVSSAAALIFILGGFAAVALLASMVWLRFRSRKQFPDGLYLAMGAFATILIAFAYGGFNFTWPFPGAIWAVGLGMLIYGIAYTTAYLKHGADERALAEITPTLPSDIDEEDDP